MLACIYIRTKSNEWPSGKNKIVIYIVTLTNLCVLLTIFEHKKCSGQDEGLAHFFSNFLSILKQRDNIIARHFLLIFVKDALFHSQEHIFVSQRQKVCQKHTYFNACINLEELTLSLCTSSRNRWSKETTLMISLPCRNTVTSPLTECKGLLQSQHVAWTTSLSNLRFSSSIDVFILRNISWSI